MNLPQALLWVAIGQTLFVLAVAWVLPMVARKEYLFGVYLGVERSRIRATPGIFKLWHLLILAIGVATALVCIGLWLCGWKVSALAIPPLAVLGLTITAFLKCHTLARNYGVRSPQLALMPVEEIPFLREPIPILLQILSWTLLVLLMIWSGLRWGHIPEQISIVWEDGLATQLENRSWLRVFLGPILAFSSLLVPLHMVTWTASRSKPRLKIATDPESKRRSRTVLRAFIWYLWGLGMLMSVVVTYVHWDAVRSMTGAIRLGQGPLVAGFALTAVTLLACVLLAIRVFRVFGVRKPLVTPMERQQSKWVIGLFYFNPEDPAFLILPRYGGSNLSINFGNRNALLIAMICAILTLSLLLLPLMYFLIA